MHRSEAAPSFIYLSFLKVWGFAELNGERRFVRRLRVTGADNKERYFRLVYDYREYILVDPACSELTLTSRSRTSLKMKSILSFTTCWISLRIFGRINVASLITLSHVVKRRQSVYHRGRSLLYPPLLHEERGYATSDGRQRPSSHLPSGRLTI